MYANRYSNTTLIFASAFLALGGCSGPGNAAISAFTTTSQRSQLGPNSRANQQSSAQAGANASGALIVSSGNIYVYTQIGKLEAEIGGIPTPIGLAVDASGNLYVANDGDGILVYKNDYKTLLKTLSDPYSSLGVAVDKLTGLVAATNIPLNGPPNVTFYAPNTISPCADPTFKDLLGVNEGAFDRTGNLYVTAETPTGAPAIGVISGGCSANAIQMLSTTNTLASVYGIQITSSGKIAIEDQVNKAIYTYNPPVNGALGSPVMTTLLNGSVGPEQFAFTDGDKSLFVADK